jgi:hypothetical protein
MGKKALSKPLRIRQRDEMATGNFLNLLSEPFARDTPLKLDREIAVISSGHDMNGDVGPVLEAAGFAEDGVGFVALLFRAGAQHILRHVVQEIRRRIEFRRIAAARRSFFPRCDGSCCIPPPAVSPGFGIIALTNTSTRTDARVQTSGAVKPAND